MDVEQFLAQLDEKKGKLARWEAEIFALHRAQVSYENIAEFLRQQSVHVCRIEVYRYIHRNKRRHLLQGAPATGPPDGTQASDTVVPQDPANSEVPATNEAASQAQDGTLPRFNWQQSRSRDKPTW